MQPHRLTLLCLLATIASSLLGATAPIQAAAGGPSTSTSVFLPLVSRPPEAGADSVTGLLVNGGTVATPRGVGIGALAASLGSPITVTISNSGTVGTPLAPPALPLGDYYVI